MQSIFGSKSIIITLLAAILTPDPALSIPLFDPESWREQSLYNASATLAPSLGIGGLQAEIQEARKLNLKPSDISYNNGYLHAKIYNQQRRVKIDPKIVKEAIRVVEKNDILVFQASIDKTALGKNEYVDETLQGTKIGKSFLDGDIGFARIVQGEVPLPEPKPRHPYQEMFFLLKHNAEYRKFTTQWEHPPESWPQIYLRFDPTIPGLISTEFKPQVIFKSPYGLALEVNEQVQSLGERPYLLLVEDVKKRPLAYRKISPSLELAASITATLGILEAACQKPGSCKHLNSQTNRNSEDSEEKKNEQKVKPDLLTLFYRHSLIEKWKQIIHKERSDRLASSPDNPEQRWVAAYDSLQLTIRKENEAIQKNRIARYIEKSAEKLKETKEITKLKQEAKALKREAKLLREETQPFRKLAKQQFLNNPIPNHPPLLAASAVIFAWNGEEDIAKNKFNQAVQLSNSPKDNDELFEHVMVLKMGLHIKEVSINSISPESIELIDTSLSKIYDEADKYLENCLLNLKKCPDKDLRKKELFLSLLPTKKSFLPLLAVIRKNNIAWLHGRINYLIGIQLEEPKRRKDRLRFLSFYASKTIGWHHWKLIRLEADFRKILGMPPRPINSNWKSLKNYIYIVILITIFLPKSLTIIKKLKHHKTKNEENKVWSNFVKKIGIRG